MRATVFFQANVGRTDDQRTRYAERQTSTEVSVDTDGDLIIDLPGLVRQEVEESGLGRIIVRLPRSVIEQLGIRKGVRR